MSPELARELAVSGVGFSLSLAELRAAWSVANAEEKHIIEQQAHAMGRISA